jgi:hypothetical protein
MFSRYRRLDAIIANDVAVVSAATMTAPSAAL